ncbi:hypothetical protein ACEQ8H_001955 [Pleosporales sp. CAS-2024a]
MHAQTIFAAAFVALAPLVSATPPACLLGAVNSYSDPSDMKSVCSAKDISSTVVKFCGNNAKDALSALADVCNGAGVKVSTDMPNSASAASGTKASPTAPGGSSNSPSALPTPTGSTPKPTPSGPSPVKTGSDAHATGAAARMEIGAAAALAGFLAVAL